MSKNVGRGTTTKATQRGNE